MWKFLPVKIHPFFLVEETLWKPHNLQTQTPCWWWSTWQPVSSTSNDNQKCPNFYTFFVKNYRRKKRQEQAKVGKNCNIVNLYRWILQHCEFLQEKIAMWPIWQILTCNFSTSANFYPFPTCNFSHFFFKRLNFYLLFVNFYKHVWILTPVFSNASRKKWDKRF